MNQKQVDALCFKICDEILHTPDPDRVCGALVPVLVAMLVDRTGAAEVIGELRDLIEQIQAAEAN